MYKSFIWVLIVKNAARQTSSCLSLVQYSMPCFMSFHILLQASFFWFIASMICLPAVLINCTHTLITVGFNRNEFFSLWRTPLIYYLFIFCWINGFNGWHLSSLPLLGNGDVQLGWCKIDVSNLLGHFCLIPLFVPFVFLTKISKY